MWRPPHIHYRVQAGMKSLITQLYFEGDPHQEKDQFIKKELIIKLSKQKKGEVEYETGTFDIVLA
jgi:protocatechuate 3,4-dioxygenase beta subunit